MKARLIRWLTALLRWLEGEAVGVLYDRARVLVAEQDARWPDRGGEAKRHQVYSRLLKEFPGEAKRRIALAIEQVL